MDPLRISIFNITNQQPHPTKEGYEVYYFRQLNQADLFEALLKEGSFFFERARQPHTRGTMYLFGVKSKDIESIDKLNYRALGEFRKPMIRDNASRYIVIIVGVLIVFAAIVGALMNV